MFLFLNSAINDSQSKMFPKTYESNVKIFLFSMKKFKTKAQLNPNNSKLELNVFQMFKGITFANYWKCSLIPPTSNMSFSTLDGL